jgi:glutathione S-transferase
MMAYIHPASPNCVAVRAAAGELGIKLETEIVDLFGQANLEPSFLALNPNGLVPVLEDEGFVLWETTAILQYLAARRDPAILLPREERARADVTRWQVWAVAHWQPALQTFIFENLFKRLRGLGGPDPRVIEGAQPRLVKFAAILETVLTKREWICGDRPTLADLTVGAYLVYAETADIPLSDYTHLLKWWSRLRRRPAWVAAESDIPRFDA